MQKLKKRRLQWLYSYQIKSISRQKVVPGTTTTKSLVIKESHYTIIRDYNNIKYLCT